MKTLLLGTACNNIVKIQTEFAEIKEAKWHTNLTVDAYGWEITFYIDIIEETKEIRKRVKELFGEPNEIKLWEKENYDYLTYTFKNEE